MWDIRRILTAGAVGLFLIALLSLPPSSSSALKIRLAEVLTPAQIAGNKFFLFLGGIVEEIGRVFRSAEVNRELEEKLNSLSREIVRLQEVERENAALRALLKFKEEKAREGVAAQVIGRDVQNWYESVLIDKGGAEGVGKDAAVVSHQGVVGKVVEVAPHTSRVLLIVDRNSRVGAVLQSSRLSGIVQGLSSGTCVISYLSRRSQIKVGENVLTSGLGQIYPAGLPLGRITRIYTENFGLYQSADVEPATDFDRLEQVMVLSGGRK